MARDDLVVTSSFPRIIGPSTWLTRQGKLVRRRYGGASGRAIDLAQVRSNPQRSYDRPDIGKSDTLTCGRMPHRKDGGCGGGLRRHANPRDGVRVIHPSSRALTPSRADRGRTSAQGPGPAVLTQRIWRLAESTGQAPNFSLTFLALEGGPMLPECPFGDSGMEHHPKPDHPRPTEEATVAVLTPNRFWRMMTDPGFPSPASNPASFMVTTEAFLGLTSQVQALAGMVQTIVPYLPQLVHLMAHQSAPPAAPPQTESPAAPNWGVPPDIEPPQPQVAEARAASPTPTPARSQSRSYNPVPTEPDFDTLSTDTADSLREQVRRVHQRLDKVQKEVLKSREEVGESSKGGSPFTPEIQVKPLPATFRLPALEPYDGSGDPTEHIATFHAQVALYDTSEALMCRAFPTTLRGSARAWYSRLKPASIPSFDLLAREFEQNFFARAHPRPTTASLLGMAQGSDEPLSQFVGQFTSQVQGILDLHPSLVIQAFLTGLRPSMFFWSLIK
ncbi:hypothetical protein BHM03_00012631 [Ensete ventricosum]|nr:hypothetical protein BHM03_00012631 [Ensete ventricosum]